jgi:alkaline ceramidase
MLDWCEENYAVLPHIVAEFGNTVSSIVFSLVGCVGMYTHSNSGFKKQPMYFQYFIMCIIGICSAFFHSTLWNMGRIMDELSILSLLYHTLFILLQLQLKGSVLGYCVYCMFILVSISLTYFYEIYNSLFILFEYAPVLLYIFWYWYHNLKHSSFKSTVKVFEDSARMFTIAGGIALVSWNVDRWSECTNTLKNMHLHSVWHLMIAVAAYYGIICFQCFYTSYYNGVLISSNIYVISWKKRFLSLDVQTKELSYPKELDDIIASCSSLDSIPEVSTIP